MLAALYSTGWCSNWVCYCLSRVLEYTRVQNIPEILLEYFGRVQYRYGHEYKTLGRYYYEYSTGTVLEDKLLGESFLQHWLVLQLGLFTSRPLKKTLRLLSRAFPRTKPLGREQYCNQSSPLYLSAIHARTLIGVKYRTHMRLIPRKELQINN
jgi:hypothetical protein